MANIGATLSPPLLLSHARESPPLSRAAERRISPSPSLHSLFIFPRRHGRPAGQPARDPSCCTVAARWDPALHVAAAQHGTTDCMDLVRLGSAHPEAAAWSRGTKTAWRVVLQSRARAFAGMVNSSERQLLPMVRISSKRLAPSSRRTATLCLRHKIGQYGLTRPEPEPKMSGNPICQVLLTSGISRFHFSKPKI